jgi:hypothetical protein
LLRKKKCPEGTDKRRYRDKIYRGKREENIRGMELIGGKKIEQGITENKKERERKQELLCKCLDLRSKIPFSISLVCELRFRTYLRV